MESLKEIYVEYEGSSGKYSISNYGNILNNNTGKILRGTISKGYKRHTLRIDDKIITVFTHVQVAKHFIPNPNNHPIVNHIDEDGTNPRVDNLEWVDAKINANYGSRNDRISRNKTLPVNEYDTNGKYIRTWVSSKYVAEVYGTSIRAIQVAAQNRGLSCGRLWQYYIKSEQNIQDITPQMSDRQLRYMKYKHDETEIPKGYIYIVEEDSNYNEYVDILNKTIETCMFKQYNNKLFEMQKVLLNATS